MTFEEIIYPVSKKDFLNSYLEIKPLMIRRNEKKYFSSFLSLKNIEDWLNEKKNLELIDLTVVHAEKKIDKNKYVNFRKIDKIDIKTGINIDKVKKLFFDEKATIILHDTANLWSPLKELIQDVNKELICSSGINVFLTPSNSQCFKAHYDENDLFIIQIDGKKHWKVYESAIELPLEPQNKKPVDFSNLKVIHEIELEAGDTLYVPRGYVHEVKTTDCLSAHITLGIINTTWSTLLIEFIRNLGYVDSNFRSGFATENIRSDGSKSEILKEIKKKIEGELNLENLKAFTEKNVRNVESQTEIKRNFFEEL